MRSSGGHRSSRKGRVRCAIYTRKSSEEGLEQEFNSLQAQREACEAFIVSQRHEGWACLATRYDDGGFSGATTDRPALQRLLADIAAGRVDTIVVYKIDRLTRSLADFAKIVEILDANGASFVSVTQQFNTTTSMGRLTLNIAYDFRLALNHNKLAVLRPVAERRDAAHPHSFLLRGGDLVADALADDLTLELRKRQQNFFAVMPNSARSGY
jgi:hypothetical protein